MKRFGGRRVLRIADPLGPDLNKAAAGSVRRSRFAAAPGRERLELGTIFGRCSSSIYFWLSTDPRKAI